LAAAFGDPYAAFSRDVPRYWDLGRAGLLAATAMVALPWLELCTRSRSRAHRGRAVAVCVALAAALSSLQSAPGALYHHQ
jgi:hypothetical protein